MNVHNSSLNTSIVDEYEAISEKALSTPTTSEQLFALKEEIEKIKEKTLPSMTQEVKQYLQRYTFIADYMQLSPILSKLQMQSIQWCNRMPYVLEEHYQIIAKKILEFQDSLKVNYNLLNYGLYLKKYVKILNKCMFPFI